LTLAAHFAAEPSTLEQVFLKECTVAANCDVCGKGPSFGHSISHSHRRTKRRWNPNIQRIRTKIGGTPQRVNACAACIKAGKVASP
jgi:large subunit ribosomal protein L28